VKQRVGASEGKIEVLALDGGAEADAVDFQVLDESLGDADDHVLDEAAGGAVKGTVLAGLGDAGDDDGSVFVAQRNAVRQAEVEFALGAFDDDGAAVEFDGDFFR
jgi:hypothetical protein